MRGRGNTFLGNMLMRSTPQGLAYGDADKIAYTQHFRAALELLRLRGPEQFSSRHGTEMFDLVMESLVRIYQLQLPWKERVSSVPSSAPLPTVLLHNMPT